MKKILLVILLLLLVGCRNSNSIVGTWNYIENNNVKTDIYYTFNKGNNGSYTYYGQVNNFTYEDRGNKIIINYIGNTNSNEYDYSINKDTLTIKDSFGNDVTYKRK